MKILVLTAIAENERDLRIVMVGQIDGALAIASPIITLEGVADSRNGNPYLVYGDAVAKFAGCDRFDTSISVFDCTSGNLEGW
jgi:hypothetical protein